MPAPSGPPAGLLLTIFWVHNTHRQSQRTSVSFFSLDARLPFCSTESRFPLKEREMGVDY